MVFGNNHPFIATGLQLDNLLKKQGRTHLIVSRLCKHCRVLKQKIKRKFGSYEGNEVAGFFVFSQ